MAKCISFRTTCFINVLDAFLPSHWDDGFEGLSDAMLLYGVVQVVLLDFQNEDIAMPAPTPVAIEHHELSTGIRCGSWRITIAAARSVGPMRLMVS